MGRRAALLSAAAYTLVDLTSLDRETQREIVEDANLGGGRFGIRVVEESVNGGARAPIYGYYKGGEDEERWNEAKEELGLTASDVDDDEARAASGVEVLSDPRREAALREAAAQRAAGEADRIRAGEASAVASITGDDADEHTDINLISSATDHHRSNIVDDTLAEGATNVDGGNNEDADQTDESTSKSKPKTKTPK